MRKTFVVVLALALGLTLAARFVLAWGPGFGPGFGRAGYGVPPIPDLTSEQSAEIQSLRDEFQQEIELLQDGLYTKRTELRDLWLSPDPDQAALLAKQQEVSQLQSQLWEKATVLGLQIRKVLTPEQLAKLPAFSKDAPFGFGPGFGPGMGPGSRMMGPMGRW